MLHTKIICLLINKSYIIVLKVLSLCWSGLILMSSEQSTSWSGGYGKQIDFSSFREAEDF